MKFLDKSVFDREDICVCGEIAVFKDTRAGYCCMCQCHKEDNKKCV